MGRAKKSRDDGVQGGGVDGGADCGIEEVEEEVHVDFSSEEGAGGGMHEEDALEEVEGRDDEEVILPV